MKTKISMLRIFTFLIAFLFVISGVYSQEKDKTKVLKIKAEDGKVIIDTTLNVIGDAFFLDDDMLKKLELSSEDLDMLKDKLKNIKVAIGDNSEIYLSNDINDKNISIWSTSVDDNDSTVRLVVRSVNDTDESFSFSLIKDDHSDEGNYIILSRSGANVDIKGDTDGKTIILKTIGAKGDSSCYVYVSDFSGGEKVNKMSMYLDGKCKMMKGAKTIAYVFNDDDGKSFYVTCFTNEDLEEEDVATLKAAGIDWEENKLKLEDLIFFPNPSDGEFTLRFELEEEGDIYIRIVNFDGKLIYKEKLNDFSGEYDKKIDIKDQPSGTYFLNIQQNNKMSTSKLIITD